MIAIWSLIGAIVFGAIARSALKNDSASIQVATSTAAPPVKPKDQLVAEVRTQIERVRSLERKRSMLQRQNSERYDMERMAAKQDQEKIGAAFNRRIAADGRVNDDIHSEFLTIRADFLPLYSEMIGRLKDGAYKNQITNWPTAGPAIDKGVLVGMEPLIAVADFLEFLSRNLKD